MITPVVMARLVCDRALRRSGFVSLRLTPMNPPASWNRSYPLVAGIHWGWR
jgi:hypothetical protein